MLMPYHEGKGKDEKSRQWLVLGLGLCSSIMSCAKSEY